jgi:hypothetical protein
VRGVRLGDEELYRFRVVKLGERVQAQAESLTPQRPNLVDFSGVTTRNRQRTAKLLVSRWLV